MNRAVFALAALAALSFGCDAGGVRPGPDGSVVPETDGGGVPPGTDGGVPPGTDAARPPPGSLAQGSACSCDAQCQGSGANAGLCVQGICMTRATGTCASAGSSGECSAGSRCWALDGVTGGICWPDCAAVTCAGECDSDGSCIPTAASTCDATCSEVCTADTPPPPPGECPPNSHVDGDGCVCDAGFVVNADRTACVAECMSNADCTGGQVCTDGQCGAPPCTATSCPSGSICSPSGACVFDIGTPPPGPPPTACRIGSSGIPDWRCTSACSEIVQFSPPTGSGYDNYPLNGETASDQYRSFIRRDVMMLVKYAAAMVACQTGGWSFGNGGPVGLGDMSEASGAIPGTREMDPGHPAGTHVNGHDMDIGYYQTGTANNYLRPICEHTTGGRDQYHCTAPPHLLDPWRSSLFLGHLHASPQLRVIGVDGQAGLMIESALSQLCSDGWVSGTACSSHRITWEVTDTGRYWFLFHHHHMHLSVSGS